MRNIKTIKWMYSKITESWVFWSKKLWLISFSNDWRQWMTVADKNLWATQPYYRWATLSESNWWKMYQRWNNYWFPFNWQNIDYTGWWTPTFIDVTWYWPWNYYSSSHFIWNYNTWQMWMNPIAPDLWWWATWTYEAMQWPCPSWFHIMTTWEFNTLANRWFNSFRNYLFLPETGGYILNARLSPGTRGCYFWSTHTNTSKNTAYWTVINNNGTYTQSDTGGCSGAPIRPAKNAPVIPRYDWIRLN